MTMKPTPEPSILPATRKKAAQVLSVEEIHDNTSQQLISITADKLKLTLIEHLDCVAKNNAWHMPLSLLVGVIVVFCSSNFKPAFGLTADAWSAIFVLFGSGCALWLVIALVKLRNAKTLDELMEAIKNK